MLETVQKKVLAVLAGGRRDLDTVLLAAGCSRRDLEKLAGAGLLRFPDIIRGGNIVCITPAGL